jgi:hypothetical protein
MRYTSDITGASGLAILDAILAGNRDPLCLAHLCNIRVRAFARPSLRLVGDYRPEHLFTLTQSLDGYRYYQKLIAELDDEVARLMHDREVSCWSWIVQGTLFKGAIGSVTSVEIPSQSTA